MNRTPIQSSQIASVGYDAATQTLELAFKNKDGSQPVYQYTGFTPQDYAAFTGAASAGSHFHRVIKGKFPYRKV